MGLKNSLIKIYNWPFLSKEETNTNQKKIRDIEWDAIATFIKKGDFLDVGCGAGYAMKKAESIAALFLELIQILVDTEWAEKVLILM